MLRFLNQKLCLSVSCLTGCPLPMYAKVPRSLHQRTERRRRQSVLPAHSQEARHLSTRVRLRGVLDLVRHPVGQRQSGHRGGGVRSCSITHDASKLGYPPMMPPALAGGAPDAVGHSMERCHLGHRDGGARSRCQHTSIQTRTSNKGIACSCRRPLRRSQASHGATSTWARERRRVPPGRRTAL